VFCLLRCECVILQSAPLLRASTLHQASFCCQEAAKRPAWRDRRPFPSLDALGPLRRGASGQRYAPPSIGGRPRKQTVDAPLAARLALPTPLNDLDVSGIYLKLGGIGLRLAFQTDNHPARRAFIALPGVVRSADVKAVPHLVVSVAERLCRIAQPLETCRM
jgi:hypothetical protein